MIAHLSLMLANRQPHEERAAVKYTTLESAVAEFTRRMQELEQAQDRLSRCTCQDAPGFEIIERGTGGYAAMENARIERLVADDARGVW